MTITEPNRQLPAVRRANPRVTHVSPIAFGDAGVVGGGERYPLELAKAMAQLTSTRLVTFGTAADRFRDGELHVTVLKRWGRFKGSEVNPVSPLLHRAIFGADVVHAHQWESVLTNATIIAGRALGKSVFATDHGGAGPNYWRQLRLRKLVTAFLPVSEFGAACYPELRQISRVILGGVDVHRFAPVATGERRREALFVGRLLPHKGIDRLIDACADRVPLRIIGRPYDLSYRDELHRLAAGKPVIFEEEASDERVVQAYQQARVVVLPSLYQPTRGPAAKKPELLGLALLEAMACGTPVVCTDVGGMPELVADDRGRVVPAADPAAMADAVQDIVDAESDSWQQMSGQARSWVVANCTWTAVARRCLEFYSLGRPGATG